MPLEAQSFQRKADAHTLPAIGSRPGALGRKVPRPARRIWPDTPCFQPCRQLELAAGRARKRAVMTLDLNGIAKGYGVDRMAAVMARFGLNSWLVGIDGEMRAGGRKPDGEPWAVGHERPDRHRREAMGVIELQDMSVATSGNYRHWREVDGEIIAHDCSRHGQTAPQPDCINDSACIDLHGSRCLGDRIDDPWTRAGWRVGLVQRVRLDRCVDDGATTSL